MDHAVRFRKRHDEMVGACHRCGWSGPVTKVRRRDRRAPEAALDGFEWGP